MSVPTFESLFVGASELAVLMRGADWSRTAVGSPEHWPQSVRAIVRMMLTSRYAMWMGWGPDLTFFYNDAYAQMSLGAKHPWALGKDASDVWAEIWSDIGPRIDHVLATGEATWDEGLLLFLERSGFPEETYHTFSYSPLHDDDGRVAGMFCVVTEETNRVIGDRRLALLREFGSHLASSQTTDEVWNAVERSLASDCRDVPFTLTYIIDERAGHAKLVASSNVMADDPIASPTIPLDDGLWPTRLVIGGPSSGSVTVDLPPALTWPSGPWPKAPTRAIVLPIAQQGHTRAAGIFIAGLNPYRPMDAEYESFIRLYVGQLAAGLASAQAYVAERLRAEALAQLDRAKTAFFSNVSHELRTPLTLMIGPVADALAAPSHALTGEALDLVHRNGLRLRRLVNTLLDFSRIEAGRIDASYQPVDLGRYTTELASAFRSAVERAGLQFVIACDADGETTYIDRDMWEKIVLNLVSNAFKFTFEGEIRVSLERRDDRIELRVRDTGRGIPTEELSRVFERFHRVEGVVGQSHEGTGIGLALVQELVKLHAGTIQVESEIDRGTTFTVTIPQGSAHLPSEQIRAERRSMPTALGADTFVEEVGRWVADDSADVPAAKFSSGSGGGHTRRPERIVLADDNADMRAYLNSLLGSIWTVELAADGLEALALARARLPDLIITDVMMPALDGFGLLRELRADERTRHVPVMMLSARAGEEARIDGFQAGADDYLVKPFTARELLAKVEARLLHARIRHLEERTTRRLAAVFALAPVPIAILRGPEHVFEVANDACLALLNRAVIGQRVADALPELMDQNGIAMLDRVYRTGEPFVGRPVQLTLNRGADGSAEACFFDVVVQPLFAEGGSIEGLAAVAYEVTELANARQAAESANRAKDEFLAMLGHELRNPLAPILTAVQLMRHRGVASGERERTVIERQVRHLVGLVDDLLDVSRITRGKVRLSPTAIELNEIVAKAIELASPLLEDQQHRLEIDVPRLGLGVMADPARLAQVITNLLTNAAKYTPAGGQIILRASSEGDQVILSVRDTGIGINPRMLPHVFDLFTQDRQAIDRAQGGLGLGLALVRSFVTLHGGTGSAHSEGQGLGSEFVVRLPKVAVDTASKETSAGEPMIASLAGARVLVVDDDEDAAAMLAEALTAAGHFVAAAHDGPTALVMAGTFKPDIALLDLGLPVMDGFELARQFRSSPEFHDTRLVAITGYGQEHDRERSASAGFDAHLVKPVDLEQLTQLVQALTSRSEKTI